MSRPWQKVWLKQRPRRDGFTFEVCYRDRQTGRSVYDRSFHDRQLAEQWRGKLELFLNNAGPRPVLEGGDPAAEGDGINPTTEATPRTPWPAAVDAWLAGRAVKPGTLADYRHHLERFGKLAGIVHLEDVTSETVSSVLAGLRHRSRASATTGAYLRVLAHFFRARPVNPITPELIAVWKPYKMYKRARPHIYSEAEFEAILAACAQVRQVRWTDRSELWWQAFLTLLRTCGLRLAEAAHLIWRDVDFAEGVVKIQSHLGLPGVFPWSPKGRGSHRTLPMSPALIDPLVKLQTTQQEGATSPYVFLTPPRYLEMQRTGACETGAILHGVLSGFVKIREKAGVVEGTLHDFRRTAITEWCLKLPLGDVQVLAGHESITTSLAIYNQVRREDTVQRVRRLLLGGHSL